ncbi:MAG: ATP-binding protein [Emergencia sp.]
MRRKKFIAVILLIMLIAGMVLAYCYSQFIRNRILEESRNHLEETYSQVNNTFSALVARNWNLLGDWLPYISEQAGSTDGMDNIRDYIDEARQKWNFTDFYLLDRNSTYRTLDGDAGYLEFGYQLSDLMVEKKNIVMDGTLPGGKSLTFFAVPVEEMTVGGFTASAIAISYNNEDMEKALDVRAFEGTAECYVIYPDGRILLSAQTRDNQPFNYMAFLKEKASFQYGSADAISQALQRGDRGFAEYQIGSDSYYLVCQPVGFQDWALLGIVPQNIVNANMNQIQWITVAAVSVLFLAVSLIGLYLMIQHTHERLRRKEAELAYREQLFSMLAGNVDDIFVILTSDGGTVEYVSPNTERLLGLSHKAIREDLNLLRENAEAAYEFDFSDVRAGGYKREERARVQVDTGQRLWYQETMFRETLGGEQKLILVLSDRTREKESNIRLEQALEIARSANEAKSSFLSRMSHDIRTPLNAITGMTQIAKNQSGDRGCVEDCLEKISRSSQHLLGLINDILDMSKIESGKLSLTEDPCSLDDILRDVTEIIRPQAEARKQNFLVDSTDVEHRAFSGDATKISQILLNLLSNSVKYTDIGGSISLAVSEQTPHSEGYARISFTVSDNGIGMKQDFIDRIFEPFARDDTAGAGNIPGTGLGMPITKALIDAMGGTISVQSEEGKGSRFQVNLRLRIEKSMMEETSETEVETAAYDFNGRRFLLAEDNTINVEVMTALMGAMGAEVERAENGKQAVEMFETHPEGYYDGIFMDVMMPVENGYEATRRIRALPRKDAPKIPIIAMTANAFAADIRDAMDAGMNAHVAKPVDMQYLTQILAEL